MAKMFDGLRGARGDEASRSADAATAASTANRAEFRAEPSTERSSGAALDLVLAMAVSMLLFAGLAASLGAACSMEFNPVVAAVSAVVALAVSFVFAREDGGEGEFKISIGLAVAIVAITAVGWVLVSGGGTQVINGFLYTLGTHTSDYQLPYASGSQLDLVVFCALASAAISYMCVQLALHSNVLACMLVTLAMCVLVVMGLVPASAWLVVLALGVAGALCVGGMRRANVRSVRAMASGIAVAAASALLAVVVSLVVAGTGAVNTSGARTFLLNIAYAIQYGGASYAMPLGQLDNLGALAVSDRPALEVETEQADCKEYLRGFTGESYDGQSWSGLDGQTVTDNQGLFYWLGEDGFSSVSQLSTAAAMSSYTDEGATSFTITRNGARGDYAYIPYSYLSGSSESGSGESAVSTNTDMSTATSNDSKTSVIASTSLLRKSYKVQQQVQNQQSSASGSARAYLDDESAYRDFVYSSYLDIPEETKATIEELFGEQTEFTAEQAKVLVQQELESQVEYDDTCTTSNGGEDFVTYFLTQSRKGYSVHYATAATMLMRYYGVPARYVEGYVLNTSTATDDNSYEGGSGTVYQLTEKNAHAWVEYYLDGVGWIPFDVTPGFYDVSFYEPTDNVLMQDDVVEWSVGDFDSETEWSSQQEQDANSVVTVELPDEFRFMLFWSLLGLAIVLVIAAIARTVLKRRKMHEFVDGMRTGDLRHVVEAGFAYGVMLGEKCLKLKFDPCVPYRSQGSVAEEGKLCGADAFAAAADANSRALFSREGSALVEEDRTAVVAFVDACFEGLNANTGVWNKFVNRIVRCIW